jgi:hypothetical protein
MLVKVIIMSEDTLKFWYIQGLQAYRSAAEQAVNAATMVEGQVTNAAFKPLVTEARELAASHHEKLVAYLAELNVEPNLFVDQIENGITTGTLLASGAAQDDETRDIAWSFGQRSSLFYFVVAFDNHAIYAQTLKMDGHASGLTAMATEARTLDKRYEAFARDTLAPAAG